MVKKHLLQMGKIHLGEDSPLVVISGPCVIESLTHALKTAEKLKEIFDKNHVQLIYKSSYDKANRSSLSSFRGPGLQEGLKILERVKKEFDLPILSDIHQVNEVKAAADVCDILQIPAFLSRQTDLLVAAGQSKAWINIKKGQFMSPWEMGNAVDKILSTGNDKIILTDRGTCFGYNNLVSDMRAIVIMKRLGFPVCFDASHSVQLPGGKGHLSGGESEFIAPLAKAALVVGANLLYIESHPNPKEAKSDKHSVLSFKALNPLLQELNAIYKLVTETNSKNLLCLSKQPY